MVKPKTHILDNEASVEIIPEIQKNCTIQLVPPDNHMQNLTERAIQTSKNHFKSILAGVDDTFPMRLWDLVGNSNFQDSGPPAPNRNSNCRIPVIPVILENSVGMLIL